MKKLVLKNLEEEISDAIIYDMAINNCIPAFYEHLRRLRSRIHAQHTSKYKKMLRDLKKLHNAISSTHKNFQSLNYFLASSTRDINKESRKLTLITPKLYEAPLRALITPINSDYINRSLMSQKIGYKIGHMVDDLNKSKFRFEDAIKLSNRQTYEIKASILYLNWFLVKPVYIRPVVGHMKYTFNSIMVKNYTSMSTVSFLNMFRAREKLSKKELDFLVEKIGRKEAKYFIRCDSDKLRHYLGHIPKNRLKTITRLYNTLYKMDLVESETLDRLPIFIMLNKLSESDYKFVKRLFDLGYNRLIHLRFLTDQSYELMQDKKMQQIVSKLNSRDF
tara:strand:- start:1877 stop:2878 length:1002 start_codon:yes stop_codon:yes gene_type:complete